LRLFSFSKVGFHHSLGEIIRKSAKQKRNEKKKARQQPKLRHYCTVASETRGQKPRALENQEEEKEETRGAQEEDREDEPFFEMLGYLCQDVHAMSLYLKIIAEHLARKKDGVEEKEDCVFESMENNCNAAVRAANAATAVVSLLVQAGVVAGILYTALQVLKKARSQSG